MNGEGGQFCDTNILVYAYDRSAGAKRDVARRLAKSLWEKGEGVVSVQVLQELFVTLTKKVSLPVPVVQAREIVSDLLSWRVAEPTGEDVIEAIDMSARWRISFWDAMILAAARKTGASVVWSEDLKDGESYEGVVVRNPFS